MKTERICFALDLIDDEKLIREYEDYHESVWPEVEESIKSAGIHQMEIYRTGNRLFMIMEVNERFDIKEKAKLDSQNSKVQEWEKLMDRFQSRLPWVDHNVKWVQMNQIYKLEENRK